MNSCLSCNKPCPASSIFCEECRAQLLKRLQGQDHASPSASLVLQTDYAVSPQLSLPVSDEHLDIDLGQLMPDSWPELAYGDSGEHVDVAEIDADQPDALALRSISTPSTEKLPDDTHKSPVIEWNQQIVTRPRLSITPRLMSPGRRRAFLVILSIALLVLLADGALLAAKAFHQGSSANQAEPTLTVTPGEASPGEILSLQISHFTPFTQVFLTRDIQVMILTDTGSSLVQVDESGNANVHIRVGAWGSGQHRIQGEDVKTHYTAMTTIQVVGGGKILPSHLVLSQTTMDMGTDLQDANTIHTLVLRNMGNGSLSWMANSDKPWLLVTPTQGMLSDSESIYVAVTRAHLSPGANYHGAITFLSSNGNRTTLQVTMQVSPLPTHPSGVLVATPPALAFTAIDSGSKPANQMIMIGNAGSQSLSWVQGKNDVADEIGQQMLLNANTQWLHVFPASTMLASGASSRVPVGVNSQTLLPGVYGMVVVFASTKGVLNNTQHVAISLTVLPNSIGKTNQLSSSFSSTPSSSTTAGIATATATSPPLPPTATPQPGWPVMNISSSSLNFSVTEGDPAPASQTLTLSNTGGSSFYWQATIPSSASSWLRLSAVQGTVDPAQSVQLAVSISIDKLSPGIYIAQLPISAVNGANVPLPNSPLYVTIKMTMYAACVLQVNPTDLSFSATVLDPKPKPQSITLSETGNCTNPVSWSATVDQQWLTLSSTSGENNATITVYVDASGYLLGKYTASITFSASEKGGSPVMVSPESLPVSLTISV
jgi:hypothetical protein